MKIKLKIYYLQVSEKSFKYLLMIMINLQQKYHQQF